MPTCMVSYVQAWQSTTQNNMPRAKVCCCTQDCRSCCDVVCGPPLPNHHFAVTTTNAISKMARPRIATPNSLNPQSNINYAFSLTVLLSLPWWQTALLDATSSTTFNIQQQVQRRTPLVKLLVFAFALCPATAPWSKEETLLFVPEGGYHVGTTQATSKCSMHFFSDDNSNLRPMTQGYRQPMFCQKHVFFAFRFRYVYIYWPTEAPRCRGLNNQWIMIQQQFYTPKKSNKNH